MRQRLRDSCVDLSLHFARSNPNPSPNPNALVLYSRLISNTRSAGMTCSNGIYGVESSNGKACCVAECGLCGGAGCSMFGGPDLGADDCCVTE